MLKRKIVSLLLLLFTVFCLACCGGGKAECALVSSTQTRVVISVSETDGRATLLNCMENLCGKEESFSYKIVGGMVVEINGKANPADYSYCWMLYTSDKDMSNAEWGTMEYDGKTLSSAVVGAEALLVEAGEIYVWEYVKF